MKKFLFILLAFGLVFFAGKQVLAKSNDHGFTPVTLCHATGSQSNPFVTITVDNQGQLDGHEHHDGDIIPAPESGCPTGQPVITDVCPNIEGTQEVVPEGYHLEADFGCIVNVPPPGPAPEPQPETHQDLTPAGPPSAPVCELIKNAPTVLGFKRLSPTDVKVWWSKVDDFVSDYVVNFGLTQSLGWNEIVHGNETTLHLLPAGKPIWVGVAGTSNGCVGPMGAVIDP